MRDTSHRHMFLVIAGNLAILVLGVIVLAICINSLLRPSIRVEVPKGGEQWALQSTHTISWSTSNIPKKAKIGVSIRRVSSPQSQTDRQEFDPVLLTNLPNTGHAAWNISNAFPVGTYVLQLHAYASLPIENAASAESAAFQLIPAALSQR